MKNYHLINILFFLMISFISCNNKESENYNKIIDSKLLFSSISKRHELLEGANYYYDKKGNLLTDIIYLSNNDSVLHYQMTVRNSKKQIIYFCECKNGIILREYDFFKFEEVNLENGSFLYQNYCKYCHLNTKDFIGKSLLKMSKLDKEVVINKYNLQIDHDTLPKLTKKQILSIVKYIEK